MERMETYEALAPLLSSQLKKGVYTNHVLSREDTERELAAGLSVEPFSGGLWIARRRGEHDLLTFYLQQGASMTLPALERPAVTEVVWRPKDAQRAAETVEALQAIGFSERFRRARREKPAEMATATPQSVVFPGKDRAAAVLAFLEAQFDGLTGCIPTLQQLTEQLERGEAAAMEDEAGICGVLHFAPGRNAMEIRHLAVRADCRGRGCASALLAAALQKCGGVKSLVWARQGNVPAEAFYEHHGFRTDGWQSAVLSIGGKDNL